MIMFYPKVRNMLLLQVIHNACNVETETTNTSHTNNHVEVELQLQQIKREYLQKIEDLEDRLSTAINEKHMIQVKLNSVTQT